MDEKTLQALTALANKLGTTAEYLWGVLVKQAPLSGALELAVMAAWCVAYVLVARYVRRKTSGDQPDWEDDVARVFAWAGVIMVGLMTALVVSLGLPGAVTAIANPEYWALRQILK